VGGGGGGVGSAWKCARYFGNPFLLPFAIQEGAALLYTEAKT